MESNGLVRIKQRANTLTSDSPDPWHQKTSITKPPINYADKILHLKTNTGESRGPFH